jgi:hypothetical protein
VNRLLAAPLALDGPERDQIARAYVHALSLFVAQRRPTTLLLEHPEELIVQTRAHVARLARAGVISKELRDAALAITFSPAGPGDDGSKPPRLARRLVGPVRGGSPRCSPRAASTTSTASISASTARSTSMRSGFSASVSTASPIPRSPRRPVSSACACSTPAARTASSSASTSTSAAPTRIACARRSTTRMARSTSATA